MDKKWLAECNYSHWDDPLEQQGQVPTAADFAAGVGKRKEGVARGGIWFDYLGLSPQNTKINHFCPGHLVGLYQM